MTKPREMVMIDGVEFPIAIPGDKVLTGMQLKAFADNYTQLQKDKEELENRVKELEKEIDGLYKDVAKMGMWGREVM